MIQDPMRNSNEKYSWDRTTYKTGECISREPIYRSSDDDDGDNDSTYCSLTSPRSLSLLNYQADHRVCCLAKLAWLLRLIGASILL
mmetsp:Transcript_20214/g.29996  ORF Transcript_20214/g.29996 Transcript_20214/m.29996 type:complete len:86 (+) Transcript_20214:75-332(+)